MAKDTENIRSIGGIWNCEFVFEQRCPKQWKSLQRTNTQGVRYCSECDEDVYFCQTPEEFVQIGNEGKCVAVADGYSPSDMNKLYMGRPSVETLERQRRRNSKLRKWWSAVFAQEPNFASKAMSAIANSILMKGRRE